MMAVVADRFNIYLEKYKFRLFLSLYILFKFYSSYSDELEKIDRKVVDEFSFRDDDDATFLDSSDVITTLMCQNE
jgi:hypothetical protein